WQSGAPGRRPRATPAAPGSDASAPGAGHPGRASRPAFRQAACSLRAGNRSRDRGCERWQASRGSAGDRGHPAPADGGRTGRCYTSAARVPRRGLAPQYAAAAEGRGKARRGTRLVDAPAGRNDLAGPRPAALAIPIGAPIGLPADFTRTRSCPSVAFPAPSWARSGDDKQHGDSGMPHALARETADVPAAKQFLLVDDHPILRDAISQTLADLIPGSRTDLATSLQESRNRFATGRRYDYVLLDLQLPDSAGHESLVQMRALAPDTPIIVVTGDARRD